MAGSLVVIGAFFALAGDSDGGAESEQVTRDPTIVAAGEVLYLTKCAVCHGSDLRGSGTGPPFLDVTYAPNHHPDEAFQRAVATGVQPHHWNFGPMAPIPDTTRDEVSLIVAFIRTRQEAAGILFDPRHS
jgi:mono/diheme cytochrome c family protein